MSRRTYSSSTYPLTPLQPSGSHIIQPEDNGTAMATPSPFAAQEALLAEINNKLPSADAISDVAKQESVLLNQIVDLLKLAEQPSKVEFIWNQTLQLLGICFVIVFGTFAVLAYNVAVVANKQSLEANQLSLLAVCLSNENPACSSLTQNATKPLASLVTAVFGSATPTVTSAPSSTSIPSSVPHSPGKAGLSTPAIVGIVFGTIAGLSSLLTSCITFRRRY